MSNPPLRIGGESVRIRTGQYVAGGLSVELVVDAEPYAVVSVHLPELTLADDEFVFKTYSENQGLYQLLFDMDLIELVRMESTALGMVPVCRLTTSSVKTQESIV